MGSENTGHGTYEGKYCEIKQDTHSTQYVSVMKESKGRTENSCIEYRALKGLSLYFSTVFAMEFLDSEANDYRTYHSFIESFRLKKIIRIKTTINLTLPCLPPIPT